MRSIRHSKIPASVCGFALILLLACNGTKSKQPKTETLGTLSEHPHSDSAFSDNEVKNEAPDAVSKTEQGYAYPKNSANHSQSPIDIISEKADKSIKKQISFAFHSEIGVAENLGHTVEVEFSEGSTCTVNGKNYVSKQFHFHTPSEHLIDGTTFPMEMHVVNILIDSASGNQPSYLVLGLLFKIGAENKFLKEFIDKIPAKEGEKNALQNGTVKFDDLLSQFTPDDLKSYYTYNGSLTTPPFTESVQWVILKHVIEASEDQIMTIEKVEGNNARHVQALNDRKVYSQ